VTAEYVKEHRRAQRQPPPGAGAPGFIQILWFLELVKWGRHFLAVRMVLIVLLMMLDKNEEGGLL
jgi:hypothetical protein